MCNGPECPAVRVDRRWIEALAESMAQPVLNRVCELDEYEQPVLLAGLAALMAAMLEDGLRQKAGRRPRRKRESVPDAA